MSFRRRITLVSAAAVTIAVVLASALTYLLTSNELHKQIDAQLSNRADSLRFVASSPANPGGRKLLEIIKDHDTAAGPPSHAAATQGSAPATAPAPAPAAPAPATAGKTQGGTSAMRGGSRAASSPSGPPLRNIQARPNQVRGYQQLIDSAGRVLYRSASLTLPVDARTRALASGRSQRFFTDARVDGVHLRILAERVAPGRVVQFAQPLTEVDNLLSHLRLILVLLDAGGIALAAVLGRLVAGAAVLPVKRLTQATEHVARTRDLSRRIDPAGEDEIGRLAVSFNAMLDALERSMSALDASVHAQRQLVADASHELRTPVTSLRTNIEILQQAEVDPEERRRMLADVVEQIEELTLLMNDLIDLARGEEPRADPEEVRLDLLVAEAIERARRRSPETPFELELEPALLAGYPARLERALVNLLDNAVKYGPPGAPVEVGLRGRELSVRDHGPGIAVEDLPHVFDRFYRGAKARGRPGSGLGLAIVRQVADQHGGRVLAEPAPGGGTLMRLFLPGLEAIDLDAGEPAGAGAPYSTV